MQSFSIFEASIDDHRKALDGGLTTSVDLIVRYLLRIAAYDIKAGLNAFTVFNDKVFDEAQASDERRKTGLPPRPFEGIPYTLKDSYKYDGLTVTNGSPALVGLMSSEDSHIASRLRQAGAVLIGKTNMPPMAAGGMQRGLYSRAESPYNSEYLTAAFSSGSSNGAATATASSFAAFGMGSETVSSGRSAASNNALVAYTPSRGIISCRGLWPLYVTCDVSVPYARSVNDMLALLEVIAEPDPTVSGDFWREQPYVRLPPAKQTEYSALHTDASLANVRIAVPKRYIGGADSHPYAKASAVCQEVIDLWQTAREDLEGLGATVIETDFPLVSNYEDDSNSGEANNVQGAPGWWNDFERGAIVAKAWDDFLVANRDERIGDLTQTDPLLLFPKPKDYVPDTFLEVRNWINYAGLPEIAKGYKNMSIFDLPGIEQALKALEEQRKRDLEEWMDENRFDCVVFPSAADVGKADLEFNQESARHALQNGIKYSNGNRALRHLGVPTVSVPMGTMAEKKMPVNLTLAGKAYSDETLLQYAYTYEQKTNQRRSPPLCPELPSDRIIKTSQREGLTDERQPPNFEAALRKSETDGKNNVHITGTLSNARDDIDIRVYVNGQLTSSQHVVNGKWETSFPLESHGKTRLSYLLEPMEPGPDMILVTALRNTQNVAAKLFWV